MPPTPTPSPAPPKDLLDYLRQKWEAHDRDPAPEFDACLDAFLTFCRGVLRDNRPIGTDSLANTLALRFQDMTSLPLVAPAEDDPAMGSTGPAVSVSGTRVTQSGIAPARAWGIGQK